MQEHDQLSALISAATPATRLSVLVDCLEKAPMQVKWPLFLEWFPFLEDSWKGRKKLLRALRGMGSSHAYLSADARQLYQGANARMQIFRGAAPTRKRGLEWSPTFAAAEAVARRDRAHFGAGAVYDGYIHLGDVLAVLDDGLADQPLIVDFEKIIDFRRVLEEGVTLQNFALSFGSPNSARRALVLEPQFTDPHQWEKLLYRGIPWEALSRIESWRLQGMLDERVTKRAASWIGAEIQMLDQELSGIRNELAWRLRNPGKDPKRRREHRKRIAKGKSTGRPKRQPRAAPGGPEKKAA